MKAWSVLIMIFITPMSAAQNDISDVVSDEEYRQAIESEITELKPQQKKSTNREAFESLLREQYPGSYNLYTELSPEQQVKVFLTYLKEEKMFSVILEIFKLYEQAKGGNRP